MASISKKQETTEVADKVPSTAVPREHATREASVDSTQFYEAADEYDAFDDFAATSGSKTEKRQQDRGGGGGSGNVYSSKHVRAKESQQRSSKK